MSLQALTKYFVIITAFATAISSLIFMAYVFLVEGWFGRGVMFIEPNLAIARFEFGMVVVGAVWNVLVFIYFVGRTEEK